MTKRQSKRPEPPVFRRSLLFKGGGASLCARRRGSQNSCVCCGSARSIASFVFFGDALPCPLACCPSAPAERIPSIDRLTTESNPSNHVHRLQRASQQAARRGPVDRSRQAPAHRRQIIGQPTPIAYRHTQQQARRQHPINASSIVIVIIVPKTQPPASAGRPRASEPVGLPGGRDGAWPRGRHLLRCVPCIV